MATQTSATTGSAERWGPLWGARARDWAGIEEQQLPTYEAAIRRAGIGAGTRVLDIGCGAGVFLGAAAASDAVVSGLDASTELAALARERVPAAEVRIGDMEAIPWEDSSFDVVTGFSSFFFAADIVAALREAARVTRPGGTVVIQVWGRPEACDVEPMKRVAAPFMPARDPKAPPAPPLWKTGVLEQLAIEAGLVPGEAFDISWAYEFPDDATLERAMLSPGGLAVLAGPEREAPLGAAIVAALAPYRADDGSYRLNNEWHFLLARRS
jgi:SAM-dependent methyltransferase